MVICPGRLAPLFLLATLQEGEGSILVNLVRTEFIPNYSIILRFLPHSSCLKPYGDLIVRARLYLLRAFETAY